MNVQFPGYHEGARLRVETSEEEMVNKQIFTEAMKHLFGVLSTWERRDWEGIYLHLRVWSSSDLDRLDEDAQEEVVKRLLFSPMRRYERSVIQFLGREEELDKLMCVRDLSLQMFGRGFQGRHTYRAIGPETAGLLLEKDRWGLNGVRLYLMD